MESARIAVLAADWEWSAATNPLRFSPNGGGMSPPPAFGAYAPVTCPVFLPILRGSEGAGGQLRIAETNLDFDDAVPSHPRIPLLRGQGSICAPVDALPMVNLQNQSAPGIAKNPPIRPLPNVSYFNSAAVSGKLERCPPQADAGVRETIEATGAKLWLLPPYSPDLNPIEQSFAKLKAHLRKAGERSIPPLWDRIDSILQNFTPEGCGFRRSRPCIPN
jgi:hypothetical protein